MNTDLFYSDEYQKAKKLTSDITDFLNNFNYEETSQLFNEAMSREHRTLQQNFTRLVLKWIEYMASDEYRTDGRNEQSKQMANTILDAYKRFTEGGYGKHGVNGTPSKWLGTI